MRLGKKTILIFLAFIVPFFSMQAGTPKIERTEHILERASLLNLDEQQKSLDDFIDHLASKRNRYRKEEQFIRYVFHKTHIKYLKHYTEQSSIEGLFTKGNYDCLTGTVLYLMIFEQLGYSYQINELDYHVYLTLTSGEQSYMIESTDPMNGVISKPREISKIEEKFNQTEQGDFYKYNVSICNTIDVEQLIGLLYFNQAVKAYNNLEFQKALSILQTAKEHYPSVRMDEFEALIEGQLNKQLAFSLY